MPLSVEEKLALVLKQGALTVAEITDGYRSRFLIAPPKNLAVYLSSSRFVRRPGDRYLLAEHADAEQLVTASTPDNAEQVTIFSLPRLLAGDFAVVDVETTGLDPEEEKVFQVSAVRFRDGKPVAVFNRYLSPSPRTLSPHLFRVLNVETNPDIANLLETAPEPDAILQEIHAFLDGVPWVAHNVSFDQSFLQKLGLTTPFTFDTLELAGLVFPTIPSLREEEVADVLGISADTIGDHADIQPLLPGIDGPSVFGDYHNALTDVLVLSVVLTELLARIRPAIYEAIVRGANKEPLFTHQGWEAVLVALSSGKENAQQDDPSNNSNEDRLHRTSFAPLKILHAYHGSRDRNPRPAQDHMLTLIYDALEAKDHCACEAPTGTGKTLAYIFPLLSHAIENKTKVALCTATRNLQDQLADELEQIQRWARTPAAQAVGMPNFRWAVLKGKGNYLCRSRLSRRVSEYLQAGRQPADEAYACLYWTAFAFETDSGLLDEGPSALRRRFPIINVWREEVKAGADCKPGTHDSCHRARLVASAEAADIVVMNHALFLHNRGNVENVGAVVADEAHELEAVATSFGERKASSVELRSLLRRLFDPIGNTGVLVLAQAALAGDVSRKAVAAAISHARRAQRTELPTLGLVFREFLRRQRLAEDPKYGARLAIPAFPDRTLSIRWRDVRRAWRELADGQVRPLLEVLAQVTGRLQLTGRREGLIRVLEGVAERLLELLAITEETLTPRNRRSVYVLQTEPSPSDVPPDWALTATPIDVSSILKNAYSDISSILVSATLDTGTDSPPAELGDERQSTTSALGSIGMRYALDRIGLGFIPRDRRFLLPPVLPYRTNAALAIARAMVHLPLEHTRESFVEELSKAYTHLTERSQGRALLLFTARSRMIGVTDTMRPELGANGIRLLVQGEDQPARLLHRFRDDVSSVLAGLRQFWQGVDVPGESLSLVFLEKLPFPMFADPLTAARARQVEMRGGNAFEDYLLPGMLIAFKQGFGRLLRDADDRGAVVLFDRRVATKTYLRRLENCLPGFVPRDPLAEATWPGLVHHLRKVMPTILSEDTDGLPERMEPPASRLPSLPLPLPSEAISDRVLPALSAFGFDGFRTPEQEKVTLCQLQHRDVLGLMPTGSGKSLTFQLPALAAADGMTIVISPLIALMRDQVEQLVGRGFENVAALYSGQASDERADILERTRLGRMKLLYVAPERLRDPILRQVLSRVRVRALVVDEAHCLYSWGPHFRPEFLAVPEIYSVIGRVPVAAVTATAPPSRRNEILQALGLDPSTTELVVSSFARPELKFIVYSATSRFNQIRGPQDKLRAVLKLLTAARRDGHSAVVYVNTTAGADLLASQLQLAGFDARSYHGKMSSRERNDVQDLFMDDHIRTVVCTKAFGMGIDKAGVRYVIHYDVPGDPVAYAQEAGRAGRSMSTGEVAYCVLIYHPADAWIHYKFAEGRLPDEDLLAAVAEDIRTNGYQDGTPGNKASTLLYEVPEAVARLSEEFPEVDETGVNVALYRLRTLGFLKRGTDVIVKALLSRAPGSPAQSLPNVNPKVMLAIEAMLAQSPEGREVGQSPVDLLATVTTLNVPLGELSDALAHCAVDGTLLLAPIQRAARLLPEPSFTEGATPTIGLAERQRLIDESLASWRAMEAWATQSKGCRAAELLRYLGEPTEPKPCGKCDLCSPPGANNQVPWGDIADDDVPRPIDHIEVAGLLLEAIAWNLERPHDGDGNMLGEKTLWAVLTGEEFYLKKYSPRRLETARRCPFFGWFRSYPGRMNGLTRLLNGLTSAGYTMRTEVNFAKNKDTDDPAEIIRYSYPDLTAKGQEALRTGEYIQLQETSLS